MLNRSNRSVSARRLSSIYVRSAVAAVVAAVGIANQAQATSGTWTGTAGDGLWTTIGNWTGAGAPGASTGSTSGETATFNGAGTTVTVDPNWNIKNITFDTASVGSFTLQGGPVTLTNSGAISLTTSAAASQTINFNMLGSPNATATNYAFTNNSTTGAAQLLLNGSFTGQMTAAGVAETLNFNGTNGGTMSGAISDGTGGGIVAVTKSGTGTWALTGANTYTGATNVNFGTLNFGTTGTIAGALNLNYGTVNVSGGAGGARSFGVTTLAQGGGALNLNLTANAGQPLTMTIGSATRAGGSLTTITGSSIGATPGNGVSTITFGTAPTASATIGSTTVYGALDGAGATGTANAGVFNGVVLNNGTSTGFATYDTVNSKVRQLNGSEQVTTYPGAASQANVLLNLAGATAITGVATNTLQLNNTSAGAQTVTNTGTALAPGFGLMFTGTQPITLTGGTLTYTTGAAGDLMIYNANTAGATLATNITSAGSGGRSITFGGSSNMTISGTMAVAGGGGFNFVGPVTFNFTNTSTSAFGLSSAGTAVYGGATLKFNGQSGNWLGTSSSRSGTRPWRIAGGSTIDFNGATILPTGTGNAIDYIADFNSNTGGGTITNSSATLSTLSLWSASAASGTQTFSGNITGNIAIVRSLSPSGGQTASTMTQVFSGTNTYTGGTTIQAGILRLGANNTLPTNLTNGTLTISANNANAQNAVFDMGGFNQTIASLAGTTTANSGIIENDVATGVTSTLTVGGSANTTYDAIIRDNNGGANTGKVALVRSGTGTLTLTGTSSAYSGGLTVSGGQLNANATGSAGSGPVTISGGTLLANASSATTGATTVNSGTLGGTGGVFDVTVNSGGNLNPGAAASVGTISTGNLTFNTGSILNLDMTAGSNDVIVPTSLAIGSNSLVNLFISGTSSPFTTAGTYTIFNVSGSIGTLSNLVINNAQSGVSYTWGTSGTNVTLTIASTAFTTAWNLSTGGTWNSGPNWTSNPTIPGAAGHQVTFGTALTSSGQVTLDGNRTVGLITFNNSGASYDIAPGTGGTLTINNNTSAGGITDSAGNHTISANIALAATNTNVTVAGASDILTFSGNISGNAVTVVGGTGTLVMTGTNTYSTTAVNAGNNLQIGNGGTTGTLGAGAVTANGNLIFNRSDTPTVSNVITGSGSVNQVGSGTTILTGANAGTWATNVSNGTLQIGNGGSSGAIGSGAVSLTGGTLAVNLTSSLTMPNVITGTGALTQNGGGTLNLTNNNSGYSGSVTVTGSTLNLGIANAAGTGPITLNNASTLAETGSTAQANNITTNGTVTVNPGAGTLTLNGNLTSTATTDVINVSAAAGKIALGGTNNGTYAGTFNIPGTTAADFTVRTAGSTAAAFNFTTSGTITLAPMTGTINFGALSGSSNIFSQSTATSGQSGARVRVGDRNDSTTYSGNITGGLGLYKAGTGSLTLSGQNGFRIDAATLTGGYTPGLPVMVFNGSLIAGSSTNGAISGPFGDNTKTVLLGSQGLQVGTNPVLAIGGAFTVSNPIIVSGGNNTSVAETGYTLNLGGTANANATFSGDITLQNNVNVTQAATTGSNHLTLSGNIAGTSALTGPAGAFTAFNNTGTQTVTFAGPGAITASGVISDGSGVVNVAASGGTSTLSGANTYTGTTNADFGRLITVKGVKNGNSMTLTNGGSIEVPLNGGTSAVTAISSLTTTGAGSHIELHDNDLVINYGTNPSAYTTTVNQVKSGLALLGGTGTEGISSAEVDGQTVQGTILAVVDDGDPLIAGAITSTSGYTISAPTSSVIVKFTWFGDSNLDGAVDGSDYALLDSGFTSGGSLGGWVFGDYDYNGAVDGSDYALIDTGFISQNAVLPEPTTLGVLGLGAMGMLRRRRKV